MAAHDHSGCTHHSAAGMSENKLRLSLLLTLAFVVVEMTAGWKSGSLALLSDAGHNFTDALALGLSWYAIWIARKPASSTRTFGYHRVGILTALFNALTLIGIAVFIFVEAWQLFAHPHAISSAPMMLVAALAFALNTGIAIGIRGEAAHNVNMRSAFIHMAGDALSSLGVLAAGIAIHFTGWVYADPLVSTFIGLFIIYSSWGIVQETVNVLLEGTPRGLNLDALARGVRSVPGVIDLHDLHVWTVGDGMNALSCHLRVREQEMPQAAQVVQVVKNLLASEYNVQHSTIETECGDACHTEELFCRMGTHSHDYTQEHAHTASCQH